MSFSGEWFNEWAGVVVTKDGTRSACPTFLESSYNQTLFRGSRQFPELAVHPKKIRGNQTISSFVVFKQKKFVRHENIGPLPKMSKN